MNKRSFVLRAGDPWRGNIRANLSSFVDRLPESKSWRIEIGEYHKTRSSEQNRYLWGVCYATLRDATGQDVNDWHEYMLGECFGWEEYEMFGRKKLRPARRSSRLSTAEFADFVAFIQQRAAENGIYIPDPEPTRDVA